MALKREDIFRKNVMLTSTQRCVKGLAAFFFFSFIAVGIVLIIGALFINHRYSNTAEIKWASWAAVLGGGVLLFIGVVGICGIFMDNFCLSLVSTVSLGLMCVCFGSLTVYAQVEFDNAGKGVEALLVSAVQLYDPADPTTT